jgi:hypothetical protein
MKLFPRIRPTAAPVLLITVLLLLQSPSFGQTTGTVTGVVADATGAVIPNAVVVLTNEQNGIRRQTVSNSVGIFAFPSVVPSTRYNVKVTATNFNAWKSQPFALRPGDQINFSDIKLAVGAAATEVTVEAAGDAVKVLESGERSDVINAKEISTLAVVGRDATELVRMLPGFVMSTGDQAVNNKPGYNTAVVGLSGPTGSFSANGTGTTGISVVSDGASLTDIFTNQGTIQNVNIDMIEELKVSTSAYGAENAKGPTVVTVIGKSGTSAFHGSGYFHARDTSLNANDWYDNYLGQSRPAGRYLYPGGTLGGPVLIPHTDFNKKRDKTFFFFGYEYYNQRFASATLGSWVPTLAERKGDFSQASLDTQLCGARPDGKLNPNARQPMCYTQNYLPNATAILGGNVVPFANPSGVALVNWLPLPNADPFTNTSGYNYIQQVLQNQNGSQLRGRIDHSFNDNNRLFVSYNRQSQIAEVPVMMSYIPTGSMIYPGGVTTGDVSTTLALNYTRVISPKLTNEFTAAIAHVTQPGNMGTPTQVGRFSASDYNCTDPVARAAGSCGTSGNGNFYYLGQFKNGRDYAMPALSNTASLGYPQMLMPGGFYNNQVRMRKIVPNLSDTVSWVKGTHLIKAGVYFEKGLLNGLADYSGYPQGQFTFNPDNSYFMGLQAVGQAANWGKCTNPDPAGQARLSGASYLGPCMNPIALMYMGYADTWQQANYSPLVNMQYTTLAGFVSDSWKVHRTLTLTLGARFEHIGPWVDRRGNGLAAFSPELYSQKCNGRNCTSDMPGITWHAQDASYANSVSQPSQVYFSPRIGVAWDIFGKGNTVLRGGWGVYRSQEEFTPYALAAATAQSYKNSHLRGTLTYDLIDSWSPQNISDFDAYVISPKDNQRPKYYEYNFTISQRLPWRSILEVAYVGSNSDNLSTGKTSFSDINLLPFGTLFNVNLGLIPLELRPDPSTGTDLGNLTTQQVDFFRTYPYYQHVYQIQHTFYSNYNSLQVSWNKTSGPIQFGANYTFSKNLAVAASYNNMLADPFNARNDYNPTPWDRTHVFNVHYLVDLGRRYHGGNSLFGHLLNGWQISGISTIQSGPPLASIQGSNFGFTGGKVVPTQVPLKQQMNPGMADNCSDYGFALGWSPPYYCVEYMGNNVWLGTPDVLLMPTVLCDPTKNPGKNQYINPNCFGLPMVGENGNYRLPYIHGPAYLNHDLSLLKNFKLSESKNLQFRVAAFNFLNHPLTSFNKNDTNNLTLAIQDAVPGQALSSKTLLYQNFGIAGIKYGGRLVQLSVKFQF